MLWIYLTFKGGFLFDDDGVKQFDQEFDSWESANSFLIDNDIRAEIR